MERHLNRLEAIFRWREIKSLPNIDTVPQDEEIVLFEPVPLQNSEGGNEVNPVPLVSRPEEA